MRIIGLFATCILFAACTTPPIFPPEIMKDVETDTFDFKAWKEQTYHPSTANFVSRKVELGGQILKAIQKPEGVVILADEQPIEKYPGYGPKTVKREGSFGFAIVFNGSLEPGMLQAGNKLAVVGTTGGAITEMIDGAPRVLPHLLARCLHIWKTQGVEVLDVPWEGSMGYYPPEHRTFCLEDRKGSSLSNGSSQADEEKGSAGS